MTYNLAGGVVSTCARLALLWVLTAVLPKCHGQGPIEPRPNPADAQARKPSLRVDADLVLVPVSVVDRGNHPVTGLEKENFRVFDNGVERTITHFAMEDEPVAVGLVYDHSGSIGRALGLEAQASSWFLRISNPEDHFFLVLFAGSPALAIPLNRAPEPVQNRVLTLHSAGSTALNDAIVLGLNELKKSTLSRRALLVLSDGGENNSRYSKTELKRIVGESDALIYAIGVDSFEANFPHLRWMAELSGGRAIPANPRELPDVAAKIANELRNRYVLGFAPGAHQRDGRYHSLRVKVVPPRGLPALRAHWRQGYYATQE